MHGLIAAKYDAHVAQDVHQHFQDAPSAACEACEDADGSVMAYSMLMCSECHSTRKNEILEHLGWARDAASGDDEMIEAISLLMERLSK